MYFAKHACAPTTIPPASCAALKARRGSDFCNGHEHSSNVPHITHGFWNESRQCCAAGARRCGLWVILTPTTCSMRWPASWCSCTTTTTARSTHMRVRWKPSTTWSSMWSIISRQSASRCKKGPCFVKFGSTAARYVSFSAPFSILL